MNINDFRKHLKDIHGTLDDFNENKQMSANVKTQIENSGKGEREMSQADQQIEQVVVEYVENYLGESLNESTSEDEIANAIVAVNSLCEAVNTYFGLYDDQG